jgi:hypothetical protein
MEFTIDLEYLKDVTVKTNLSPYKDKEDLTPEELVRALSWPGDSYVISSIDHPEFTKLRESLEKSGYIYIQRGWWNGDTVLKPFTLNGFKFKKDGRFPCASALGVSMKCALERGRNSLLL